MSPINHEENRAALFSLLSVPKTSIRTPKKLFKRIFLNFFPIKNERVQVFRKVPNVPRI